MTESHLTGKEHQRNVASGFPTYYAWDVAAEESKPVFLTLFNVLKDLAGKKEFTTFLAETLHKDLLDKLKLALRGLHCTAKYCGNEPVDEVYSEVAKKFMNSTSTLQIRGYNISKGTVCARVELIGEDQKLLWDNDLIEQQYEEWSSCDQFDFVRHPTCGKGARSHLTLFIAPPFKAMNSGIDLIKSITAEHSGTGSILECNSSYIVTQYPSKCSVLINLVKPFQIEATFQAFDYKYNDKEPTNQCILIEEEFLTTFSQITLSYSNNEDQN